MSHKIVSIENLKKILSKVKRKKTVLCHGVFDLLHIGHISHFQEARNYGDIIVASVTSDKYVNKGPDRPAFNEHQRLKALASLEYIDYVVLNNSPTAIPAINELRPNIYCKGKDYKNHKDDITGEIKNEINALKKTGGKIIYTKGLLFSSSNLINRFIQKRTKSQRSIIEKIKKNYSFPKIKKSIENFKKLKVLIIGETIIDQYVFCNALGKSGKEPMLVLGDIKTEQYLGGAAAISRHISPFCEKITLLSMIGEKSEFLKDIKKGLPRNVKFDYIKKKNSPTIVKKRFLDHISNNKVLGVYKINYDSLEKKEEILFRNKLNKLLSKYDVVIVSDYGHGFISKISSKIICKKSKYLALNAQINAANVGYHSMRNYKKVDCVIINDREIHQEMREKNIKTEILRKKFSFEQKINNIIVTRGKEGALSYNKSKGKYNYCQAFANTVVDKIGAGDAMLSLIALCLKSKLSSELSLLIASLAAAQSTEIIGNKESVSKIKILKTLEHLLK